MKKLLILLAVSLVVILSSCEKRNSDGYWEIDKNLRATGVTKKPLVEVIDSCEYIIWRGGMAHKGNCRFCAARRDVVPAHQ